MTDEELDALVEALPEPERTQALEARRRLDEMADNATAGRGLTGGLTSEEIRKIYHDQECEEN